MHITHQMTPPFKLMMCSFDSNYLNYEHTGLLKNGCHFYDKKIWWQC